MRYRFITGQEDKRERQSNKEERRKGARVSNIKRCFAGSMQNFDAVDYQTPNNSRQDHV